MNRRQFPVCKWSIGKWKLPLFFLVLFSGIPSLSAFADNSCTGQCRILTVTYSAENHLEKSLIFNNSPNPFRQRFRKKTADNRRLIAACLSFPLPLGFLGVHRIFLGTNPYVPVAYAGTLGGCLGAVPLADFFVIVFSKNLEQYTNNPRFFMWIKKKQEK